MWGSICALPEVSHMWISELTAAVMYILITPTSLPRILGPVSYTQVHHSKEAHVSGVITIMSALKEV